MPAILRAGQEIVAIAGRDQARLSEFQNEFSIASVYSWQAADRLLEHPSVDAVYIPLPNSLHAEWTVRALNAGKHVLCEKPLALTVTEAERIIAAARGRVLMENFSYHLTPGYLTLSRDRQGAVAIQVHHSFRATEDHRLRYNPALGGGSFLDLGCYGVDFVHRLLDSEIEIGDVLASPPAPGRRTWGDIDETCVLHGRAAGANVSIMSSFAESPRQDFTLQFASGEQRQIPRSDDVVALLHSFAGLSQSDPADVLRWRRNASVLEQVQSRIAQQMQY